MYTAHITLTRKGYERGAQWMQVNRETLYAETLTELKQDLKSRYGKSWKNKRPTYRDKKDGTTVRSGWVVGFREEQQDRSAVDGVYRCIGQDWVCITEDHSRPLEWAVNH